MEVKLVSSLFTKTKSRLIFTNIAQTGKHPPVPFSFIDNFDFVIEYFIVLLDAEYFSSFCLTIRKCITIMVSMKAYLLIVLVTKH